MRKATRNKIAGLFIVFIFGMSSIAFVVSFFGSGVGAQQNNDIEPLQTFVIDGEVEQRLEDAYVQGGFTWMKFYYTDTDGLYQITNQLPEVLKAPNGQTQLVVQRFQDTENRVFVYSAIGQDEINDPTENELLVKICSVLTVPPADCAFLVDEGNETITDDSSDDMTDEITESETTTENETHVMNDSA
jgi:hypothetical protein